MTVIEEEIIIPSSESMSTLEYIVNEKFRISSSNIDLEFRESVVKEDGKAQFFCHFRKNKSDDNVFEAIKVPITPRKRHFKLRNPYGKRYSIIVTKECIIEIDCETAYINQVVISISHPRRATPGRYLLEVPETDDDCMPITVSSGHLSEGISSIVILECVVVNIHPPDFKDENKYIGTFFRGKALMKLKVNFEQVVFIRLENCNLAIKAGVEPFDNLQGKDFSALFEADDNSKIYHVVLGEGYYMCYAFENADIKSGRRPKIFIYVTDAVFYNKDNFGMDVSKCCLLL